MLRRFVVVGLFVVTGCSAEASGPSEPKVRLAGSIGGGTVHTQTFGDVAVDNGGLHVAARQLVHQGQTGAVVDVPVAADGHWSIDLARNAGERWVITVDGKDGHSALLTFAGGKSALAIGANGEGGTVDFGDIHIVGGEAQSNVVIDGRLDLAATLAEADEVFKAADGALIEAQKAVAAAEKAAEDAEKAAADAEAAAAAAQKAAADAQKLAGQ